MQKWSKRTSKIVENDRGVGGVFVTTSWDDHAYRHLVDCPDALRLAGGNPKKTRQIYWNWDELAMTLFDRVLIAGGVYHLWGHSWEIERNKDWLRIERVLSYISNRPEVKYIDNGELAAIAR